MNFDDALKILGIYDYRDRIINSNSHGELFHCLEYIEFVSYNQENGYKNFSWFRKMFITIVEHAEKEWKRPESIFQHVFTIINESFPDGVIYAPKEDEEL